MSFINCFDKFSFKISTRKYIEMKRINFNVIYMRNNSQKNIWYEFFLIAYIYFDSNNCVFF